MKYKLASHVSLTEDDDEAVLLDLNSGAYYGLNHVGALLMSHLQEQKSLEFANAAIAEHYQTPHAMVSQDIKVLVEQLLELKLIIEI